ncbi:pyridoxamine 5-phosphate oxidase [Amycolatopsis sp. K13G38]|uniref:Pyridoxamine 5-phosphate oxidase n=1 Tax=Amycolatopsis acididurans TaxID=2724524 RepID=A0ABX1JFP9_9PSEU|nr:pyridoxamine 5'-phosphate oxidase family protein [Amycolatopsis acididurans]NKQ58620.1 pyridoxamine 5-phosphate oxidase [Amycolatopsis acididurans]
MKYEEVAQVLAKPLSRQLLDSAIPARLAYTGLDGAPRVIPIGTWWNGTHICAATVPNSAKVPALRKNPKVAITIDTEGFPPNVLLIRGTATLELFDGVPQEYIDASRQMVPAEQFDGWEAGVRALYEQMVVITIEPTWAKLLDFETTLPKAVEDLVRARQD